MEKINGININESIFSKKNTNGITMMDNNIFVVRNWFI